jgi:hypothetical protein
MSVLRVVRQQSGNDAGADSNVLLYDNGVTEPCREWPRQIAIGEDYVSTEESESWPIAKLGRTMTIPIKYTRQFDHSIAGSYQ